MKSRVLLIAYFSASLLAASAAASSLAAAETPLNSAAQSLAGNNLPAAIEAYSTVLAGGNLNTNETIDALLHRAFAYQNTGEFEKAIEDYSKAMRLGDLEKTVQVTVYYNRGLAWQNSGNLKLAIEDFTNALFADRQFAYGYYARANALRENGNFLFALSDYEKCALYNFPQAHLAFYGEALTYEKLNRPLKAEALLQQALAVKPDFSAASNMLGELRNSLKSGGGNQNLSGEEQPVVVSSNSYYGIMSDRIDQIVTSSISAVAPDQVVRKSPLPTAVRPPRHLLDAAEEVQVATMQLPNLQTIAVAETPGYVAPGFVVAEKTKFQKFQDRISSEDDGQTQSSVHVEPVSAPVEFTTKTTRDEQVKSTVLPTSSMEPASEPAELSKQPVETATVDPQPKGWLVQINSQRTEDAAWAAWKTLKAKNSHLLASREAIVQKAELAENGTVYRVRINGLGSQNSAKDLCQSLKNNHISCFVVKAGS